MLSVLFDRSQSYIAMWTVGNVADKSSRVTFPTDVKSSIKYECSKGIAERGAHLMLVCGNRDTMEAIAQEFRYTGGKVVDELVCDTNALERARECADS